MPKKTYKKYFTILGATGDLGSHLAKYLINKNYPVQLIVRKGHLEKLQKKILLHKSAKNIKIIEVDTLLDKRLLEDILVSSKIIYNLAGLVSLSFRAKTYPNVLLINGFLPGLLAQVNNKYNKPIVYASTQRIKRTRYRKRGETWSSKTSEEFQKYIATLKKDRYSEKDILSFLARYLKTNPVPNGFNIYEISKHVGEKMLMGNRRAIILRVSACYGSTHSARRTIGRLILARIVGQKIKEIEEIRDYIYVDDLNEILEKLVGLKSNKVFIEYCCSGISVSKSYIIEKISQEIPEGKGALEVIKEDDIEIFRPTGEWLRNFLGRPPTNVDDGLSKVITEVKKKFLPGNMGSTQERLFAFYDTIRQKTDEQGIDPQETQTIKDKFFIFKDGKWVAREAFCKPTGLVFGYPFQSDLADKLDSLRLEIVRELGLRPHNYWVPNKNELHSTVVNYSHYSEVGLNAITMPKSQLKTVARIVSKYHPIHVLYKGVLITSNGSILMMGFVDNEDLFNLRRELTKKVRGITQQPQNLAHIKLAQILTDLPYELTEKINRLYSSVDLGTYTFTNVQTPYKTLLNFH